MKKYKLFLLVSILSLILLVFNVKAVNASDSGCTAAGPYNTQTGQLCSTTAVSVACPAGDLFSPMTGQPCSKTTTVSTSTTGDLNQGLKVGSKGDSVKTLQQTLKNAGLLSGTVDGIYGKLTSAAVQKWYQIYACPITSATSTASGVNSNCVLLPPTQLPPTPTNPTTNTTITVVSPNGGETWVEGTNQNITWKDSTILPPCAFGTTNCPPVAHYDIQLAPSYAVCTGKVCPMMNTTSMLYRMPYTIANNVVGTSYLWDVGQVIPLLANSSSVAPNGSYTIQVCTVGTGVCDSSDAAFSITSGTTTTGTLSVVSPNGGETWVKGTNQTISWQDNGTTTAPSYNIQLIPYHAPCTTNMCPMIAYPFIEYNVANNVSGTSYPWTVGNILNGSGVYPLNAGGQIVPSTTNSVAPNGSYTIQVCTVGTGVCDSSDAPFSIVSEQANGTVTVTN